MKKKYLDTFPKAQCICGCTTFVLKRNYNCDKRIPTKICTCSRESKANEISDCPSDGCQEYLKFIRVFYIYLKYIKHFKI